jgi:hypothetical protein
MAGCAIGVGDCIRPRWICRNSNWEAYTPAWTVLLLVSRFIASNRWGLPIIWNESVVIRNGHVRWQVFFEFHIYYSYFVIYLVSVGWCPDLVSYILTSPYLVKLSLIFWLFYFFSVPIPASSIITCDNSPLSCLNSSSPLESCSTDGIRSSRTWRRLVSLVHWLGWCVHRLQPNVSSRVSIRGFDVLLGSKQHTMVFCLSLILAAAFSLLALLTRYNQTLHRLLARSALLAMFTQHNTTAQFHYSAQTDSNPQSQQASGRGPAP